MLTSVLLLALLCGAVDVNGTPAPSPASTSEGTNGGPTIAPDTPAPTFLGTSGGPTFNPYTLPPIAPGGKSPCFDPDSSVSVTIENTDEGGIRIKFNGCAISDADLDDVAALFDEMGRTSITAVWLSDGTITTLPKGYFQGLDNLRFLSLFKNELASLPAGIFDDLPELGDLGLSYNRLTTLPAGVFDGLSELTWLEMGFNEFGTIEAGTFDALTKLVYLDLTDTSLVSLPLGLFDAFDDLSVLQINLNYDLQCIPYSTAVVYWYWSTSTYGCDCTQAEEDACGDGFTCNPVATVHECTAGGYTTPPPSMAPGPTPTGSVSLGCFKDERDDRILETKALVDTMTTELCELTCAGYSYFSTQYGRECWCGEADADYAKHGESTVCDYECTGNPDETCGGFFTANVYAYAAENTPPPTANVPMIGYLGCFEDEQSDRIMELALSDGISMTREMCEAECTGSTYFGLQYGQECWCGGQDIDYAKHGVSTACDYECPGSPSETCGGFNAVTVYVYLGVTPYLGCFEDKQGDRIMELALSDKDAMTQEVCEAECRGRFFDMCEECSATIYFGLQYGRECWCGDQDTDLLKHGESTSCDHECLGNPDEICGGFNAMDVYESFIVT